MLQNHRMNVIYDKSLTNGEIQVSGEIYNSVTLSMAEVSALEELERLLQEHNVLREEEPRFESEQIGLSPHGYWRPPKS